MKLGKLAFSAVVLAVIMFLMEWLWYGMLMKDSMKMPDARPEPLFVYLVLGNLIFSFAFAYIFSQGKGSGTPMGEGARFGFWVTLLAWVPMGIVWCGLTTTITLQQSLVDDVFRLVQMVVMGVVAAYMMSTGGSRGTETAAGKSATGGDG